MKADLQERTVRIPIRVGDTGRDLELFYGGSLPKLKPGTIGDLMVPAFAFLSKVALQPFLETVVEPFLPAGTKLLLNVPGALPSDGVFFEPACGSAPLGTGPFVELELVEPLGIVFRATKRAMLRPCRCRVPALNLQAKSVNHAYSLVSRHVETGRRSHTGNVFAKALYLDRAKPERLCWRPLDDLRCIREEAIEAGLFTTPSDSPWSGRSAKGRSSS